VLGGLLRGASLNTIKRLVEDITSMVERVRGCRGALRAAALVYVAARGLL